MNALCCLIQTLELRAQIHNPSKKGGVVPQCVYISDDRELLSGWSDGQLWCHDLSGNSIWNIHSCHISASGTVMIPACFLTCMHPLHLVRLSAALAAMTGCVLSVVDTPFPLLSVQGVSSVSMAHEGKFLATGGNNGDVRIWDKGSRELVAHLTQHKVGFAAWWAHPAACWLFSWGGDNWDNNATGMDLDSRKWTSSC